MNKEDLIEKLKPYMYCYVGSGMLSNDYDEKTALSFANSCADIAEEYASEEKKKEAIAFAEWISRNYYLDTAGYYNREGDGYALKVRYEINDIYELFNQQK